MARPGVGLGLGFHRPAGLLAAPNGFDVRPWISEIYQTYGTLSFVSTYSENIYLLILPDGAPAPTAAAIRALADYVMSATAHAQFDQGFSGLTPDTAYDFWIVSTSFDQTMKLDVHTLAPQRAYSSGFAAGYL